MLGQQSWTLDSVEDVATKLVSVQPVVRSMIDQVEHTVGFCSRYRTAALKPNAVFSAAPEKLLTQLYEQTVAQPPGYSACTPRQIIDINMSILWRIHCKIRKSSGDI